MLEKLIDSLIQGQGGVVTALVFAVIYLFFENKKHNQHYIELLKDNGLLNEKIARFEGKREAVEMLTQKTMDAVREAILNKQA